MKYLVFLLLIVTNVFSQASGDVLYEVKFNLTIEKIDERVKKMKIKPNDEVILALKKRVRNSGKINSKLNFSNSISNYELMKDMKNDVKSGIDILRNSSGGDKLYYTSILKQECLVQDCKTMDKCYAISKEKPIWKLTQETKLIGKYLCYKAINVNSKNKLKKPIAWYTNEIPLGFGPKDYFGLPGLILELEEAAISFKAKTIVLNPIKNTVIKSVNGEKISEKNFKSLLLKSFPELYKPKE